VTIGDWCDNHGRCPIDLHLWDVLEFGDRAGPIAIAVSRESVADSIALRAASLPVRRFEAAAIRPSVFSSLSRRRRRRSARPSSSRLAGRDNRNMATNLRGNLACMNPYRRLSLMEEYWDSSCAQKSAREGHYARKKRIGDQQANPCHSSRAPQTGSACRSRGLCRRGQTPRRAEMRRTMCGEIRTEPQGEHFRDTGDNRQRHHMIRQSAVAVRPGRRVRRRFQRSRDAIRAEISDVRTDRMLRRFVQPRGDEGLQF